MKSLQVMQIMSVSYAFGLNQNTGNIFVDSFSFKEIFFKLITVSNWRYLEQKMCDGIETNI